MSFVALFVTATKLAGLLVTVTVAANAFSFSRFKKKNLRRFRSPIDESADTLADFNVNGNIASSLSSKSFKNLTLVVEPYMR
jgi:hypothetical protein